MKVIEKNSAAEKRVLIISVSLILLIWIIDQITKFSILHNFKLYESKEIIPNLFSLTFVTNKGAAWGILAGKWYLLLSIAIVTIIICIVFFRKITEGYFERFIALALLLAGVFGNSFDRIYHGEVIDFLDFYLRIGSKTHHWPAFNVADMAICIGVFIFMLSTLLRKSPEVDVKKIKIEE